MLLHNASSLVPMWPVVISSTQYKHYLYLVVVNLNEIELEDDNLNSPEHFICTCMLHSQSLYLVVFKMITLWQYT